MQTRMKFHVPVKNNHQYHQHGDVGLSAVATTSDEAAPTVHTITPAESDVLVNDAELYPRARHDRRCRHVAFASVHTREYSTILGDNPSCQSGPPLSLGWTIEREERMEFEAYETERESRLNRREKETLRLDDESRREILRSLVVDRSAADDPSSTSTDVDVINSDWGGTHNDVERLTRLDGVGGGCRVYAEEDLRRAELIMTQERNSRAHRRTDEYRLTPMSELEICCHLLQLPRSETRSDRGSSSRGRYFRKCFKRWI